MIMKRMSTDTGDTARAEGELGRKLGSDLIRGASKIESVLHSPKDSRLESDSNSRHMRL